MSLRLFASLVLLLGSAGLIGGSLAPAQTEAVVSQAGGVPGLLLTLAEKPDYASKGDEPGSLSQVLGERVEATQAPVVKATRPPRPTATPTVAKTKQKAVATATKAPTRTPTPQPPAKTATAKAQPSASTTPAPAAVRTVSDLSAAIDAYLENRGGRVAFAVYNTDGMVLSRDGDAQFALASLAKVHIVTAYLTALADEGREPTAGEEALIRAMIGVSDNESADALWDALGGAAALEVLMDQSRFPQLLPGDGGLWGSTADSPDDVARLFLDLYETEHVPDEVGSYVLAELARVTSTQRWGVTAGSLGADVYVKNGWYPGEEGWRVTSAGLVLQRPSGKAYGIAIMMDRNTSFDAGKTTIEGVAKLINTFLLTQS